MTQQRYLTYRGDITDIAGVKNTLYFVTVHPENVPTAIYRIELDAAELYETHLPCGGLNLVADEHDVWVSGSKGQLYHTGPKLSKPKALGSALPKPAHKLLLLPHKLLAALSGSNLLIIQGKDGHVQQTLDLEEETTQLAIDPTGNWLVVGTVNGSVAVFERESQKEFKLSERDRLHEGQVTSLLFEPDELRFFSAGADHKLLSSFARGKLEPEDKGRGNVHDQPITAMLNGPADRILTGAHDGSLKSWPRAGHVKPSSQKDGVANVNHLALIQEDKKTLLVAACADQSLRYFLINEEGRVDESTTRVYGALAYIKEELNKEVGNREAALKLLAEFGDGVSVETIAKQMDNDGDHGVRLLAAQLLTEAKHPRAIKLLEAGLKHNDEKVRLTVLAGLRKQLGEKDLRPLDLALKTEKADIGTAAIEALQPLAKTDDQARARLIQALDAKTVEIRTSALLTLESVFDAKSPEADLTGLTSSHADLRRRALLRLYQRNLLDNQRVETALRWRGEDADADVRRTAFLLSLHTRPDLAETLRKRDVELDRQLKELEKATKATKETKPKETKTEAPQTDVEKQIQSMAKKSAKETINLKPNDYEPLLQATSSRSLDTCLRGARGLAVLGDVRAFGLLLQLSREELTQARVEVCFAMAALEDERSVHRLRSLLFDNQAAVRDAAFSALAHIYREQPLQAAEYGLNSSHEDVRRRGLQLLVEQIRKKKPESEQDLSWQLMLRALNDSGSSVRGEATKSALNLQIAGGGIKTLRFLLKSLHADVRREALTEVMAQFKEQWAWNLLLEFYNDADPGLREEAFVFAIQKKKDLEPLSVALMSQYADTRKRSVQELSKKHNAESQALLVKAISDNDKAIRGLAITSLVADAVVPALKEALGSEYADVRVRAAGALARRGEMDSLQPLLELAGEKQPEHKEREEDWASLVQQALRGLAELGAQQAVTDLLPILQYPQPAIRKEAAWALVWCSRPDSLDALRATLQHSDPQVKHLAALGLAYAGDPLASSILFASSASQYLSSEERLAAALTLGSVGEDQLITFLDDADESLRKQTLLILMLLELKTHEGNPSRCLAALASKMPRVRLTAARALENFSVPETFSTFVVNLVNDRGDEPAWTIKSEDVQKLANLFAFAPPRTKAVAVDLLKQFQHKEQQGWDQNWAVFEYAHAKEIEKLQEEDKDKKPTPSKYPHEQLQKLAFGAYVGLVREQGGTQESGASASLGAHVIRIRQSALRRLLELAQNQSEYAQPSQTVFIQALADPHQAVRSQAFEQLLTMKMNSEQLGAESLEAGHLDIGVKGLELLSAGAKTKEGQAALEKAMMTRNDALAMEAAKLLIPVRGKVPVSSQGLEAIFIDMRKQALAWLVEEYENDDQAKNQLRQALQSRYPHIRNRAALELANKKDSAAFPALVEMLKTRDESDKQKRIISSLETLNDPRTPDALLDRLENDPAGTAQEKDIFQAVGNFRNPEITDRLLKMAENSKWRKSAMQSVVTISGFDQRIEDFEEEKPDQSWQTKQHPRHADVLAKLMEKSFALGDLKYLESLVYSAKWAKGAEVEPILVLLANHPDDALRYKVVDAIGWRARKRDGSIDPLLKALQHKNPDTQFIAAEALAKAKRAEGLSVLLSSIEFQTDFGLRRRAVMALGELADARSLDVLLKLANEDGHALQEAAAESLGHMGKSEQAEEIFHLLERLSRGQGGLSASALRGLRWFNTHAGWQLIRQKLEDSGYPYRPVAIELLGYNDDPATRDLLLKTIAKNTDGYIYRNALNSARRLWGEEALEPDYALLQNPQANSNRDPFRDALKRVSENGEAATIFPIIAHCPKDISDTLITSLMNRVPPPLNEAKEALVSLDPQTAQLAAHILGRSTETIADAGPAIEKALSQWLPRWQDERKKEILAQMTAQPRRGRRVAMRRRRQPEDTPLQTVSNCIKSLLWTAGKLQVAQETVMDTAEQYLDDRNFNAVRLEALNALARFEKIPDKGIELLKKITRANDPDSRTTAADILARFAPVEAAGLAEPLLSDRTSFNRIANSDSTDVTAILQKAAAQVHYQGVSLPHMVARKDVASLMKVIADTGLPETTRHGAVEALAAMAHEEAETKLVEIGKTDEDEEIRKAAWRGLRRSKRKRAKLATANAEGNG